MTWIVLLHVIAAFAFVAGLVGRDLTIARARHATDLGTLDALMGVADRFDSIVKIGSIAVLVFGVVAMIVGDLSLAGNGWLAVSLVLFLGIGVLVPTIFVPRGKVFERTLADAHQRGQITPELSAALGDRAVALARNAELVAVVAIVVLMVVKPF